MRTGSGPEEAAWRAAPTTTLINIKPTGNEIEAIAATYRVNGLQNQPIAYDISCAATSLALPRLGLLSDKSRKSGTRNLGMSF
jgi:hypothetical protein